ncbi:MAG: M15 family metallopeptidase [Alteromonas sp.]|nr:M15 family metallopeptidase [Alteromonas sp.]
MKLGEKQELFMRLLPRLIDQAHSLGFEIRGGDLFRDPRVHGKYGVKKSYASATSNHKLKCAIDLNLMKNGVFMRQTSDHRELGEWWEKQHEMCKWGGRFRRPDGNHYEVS